MISYNKSRALATMALAGVVSTSAYAATVLDLRRELPSVVDEFQKQSPTVSIGGGFGIAPIQVKENELRLVREQIDNGIQHRHYAQYFMNIPVWGRSVIIHSKDNVTINMNGDLVKGISADIFTAQPSLNSYQALTLMKNKLSEGLDPSLQWSYTREQIKLVVYVNDANVAQLAFFVSFYAKNPQKATYPHYLIDAMTGEVLKEWNGIINAQVGAKGIGGNLKTGQYEYGTDFGPMQVENVGSKCTMDNPKVQTFNSETGSDVLFEYSCSSPDYRNDYKPTNGAYSPLNDAHFFGGVVYDMYQDWLGTPPLPFIPKMYVHDNITCGGTSENACWDGLGMHFGDGGTTFYPLVGLDVMAHEISHGFTNLRGANLFCGWWYNEQSCAINESFSDMSGEATKFFFRGSNDWTVGADIFKAPNQAGRYMCEPTLDGVSIDHASNWNWQDAHYSSGIFNKAFCLLAKKPGWNTRTAFEVMADANRLKHWKELSTFTDAACGVEFAALNRGYDFRDVHKAFVDVGVTCPNYPYYTLYLGVDDNAPDDGLQGATDNFPRETAVAIAGKRYSGPPAAQVTLQYITASSNYTSSYGGSVYTGTQNDIYATHTATDGKDMTAAELEKAINAVVFDPFYVPPSYNYPYHYGQIEKDVEIDALKMIIYWADYLPNGGRHGPVMVPTHANQNSNTWGENNHWKVIRGIVTTPTSATGHGGPYKQWDTSQLASVSVIGFLVNDPMLGVNDLGYYTYQSADDFQVNYHPIDGKYRAVLEPPIDKEESEAALSKVDLEVSEPIANDSLRDALSEQPSTRSRQTRDGKQRDDLVAIIRDTAIPGSLILNPTFNPVIKAVNYARTFTVDDLESGKPYVIVALGPEANDNATVLV